MQTLGERVRYSRLKRGLSQKELSDLVPMSQPALQNIENGRNRGSTKLVYIAIALNVNPIWLHSGEGLFDLDDYNDSLSKKNDRQLKSLVPLISWETLTSILRRKSKINKKPQ